MISLLLAAAVTLSNVPLTYIVPSGQQPTVQPWHDKWIICLDATIVYASGEEKNAPTCWTLPDELWQQTPMNFHPINWLMEYWA